MSNTPRTDAAEVTMLRLDGDADVVVAAFFARQLERELIAARSATGATALLQRWYDLYGESTCDRNEEQDAMLKLDRETREYLAAAPRVEEEAIGHARYEYIRTLNPREFAVLWDEAIYDPFDDLVDRHRMKGEPDRPDWAQQLPGAEIFDRVARGDHGYDRTASLSAGRYVCLCGGTCSHHDAREPRK